MLVKILKLWDIKELNKVPLLDDKGDQKLYINAETGETTPLFTMRPYQVDDTIELTDARYHLAHNMAVEINPVTGEEVHPVPLMPTDTGETKSGRVFWDSNYKKKFAKDDAKMHSFIEQEKNNLLDKLSQIMLLSTADRLISKTHRENFLDHQSLGFLRSVRETVRQIVDSEIDDRSFQLNHMDRDSI